MLFWINKVNDNGFRDNNLAQILRRFNNIRVNSQFLITFISGKRAGVPRPCGENPFEI